MIIALVDPAGDMYMDTEKRPFIGQLVEVIKQNKSGLFSVRLLDGTPTTNIAARDLNFGKVEAALKARADARVKLEAEAKEQYQILEESHYYNMDCEHD